VFLARLAEQHPRFEQTVRPPSEACDVVETFIGREGRSRDAFRESTAECVQVKLRSSVPQVPGGQMFDRARYIEVRSHTPAGAVATWEALAEVGAGGAGLSYAFDYVAVSGSSVQWLSTGACAFEGAFGEIREILEGALGPDGPSPEHVLTCRCGLSCSS